jgi:uncharacterized repeat protein (TIGR01451 family)
MLGAFQGTFGGGRDCIVARFNATGTGPGADLTVSNSAPPGPLLSGDPLTYTVTVANEGPDPATGVRLTVPLPGGVAFQSATAGCALDSGAVSCPLGTIGSGSSSVITIDATAQAPSTVTTVATASATSFDPDCSDNTGAATTRIVAPVLAVLDPNGGETVPSGGSYPIVWSAPAGAATFDLAYSMNDGSSWAPIASGLTGRTFPWSTPRPRANAPRSLVRIKAYDAAHSAMGTDFSDGPFTVEVVKLLAPNGLEVMSPGEVRVISWRTNGTAKPIAKVVLKYTTNEGKKWIPITKFIGSNPGSYAWTVPAVSTAKTRCKVRVVLKDAKNTKLALDDSDALFTINP